MRRRVILVTLLVLLLLLLSLVRLPQAILSQSPYWSCIESSAKIYSVSPLLIASLIQVESQFDPFAIGDNGLARGLGQFHKATWEETMGTSWDEAWNACKNIEAIARYMNKYGEWLRHYHNIEDPRWVLACYRWGAGRVSRLLKSGGSWEDVPIVFEEEYNASRQQQVVVPKQDVLAQPDVSARGTSRVSRLCRLHAIRDNGRDRGSSCSSRELDSAALLY